MSREVIVSFLWPKNATVLLELAKKGGFDIAAPPSVVPANMEAQLGEAGLRFIPLIGTEFNAYAAAAAPAANERFAKIAAELPRLVATPQAATQERVQKTVALLETSLPVSLRNAMAVIDELDSLLTKERIAAVLVNETDVVAGRLLALWAKERGIPSFLLSHGSNIGNAYSVTRCMHADYLFVFGPRGRETYLDIGIPAERMIVTGNPAWDRYPQVLAERERYRKDAYERLGLRAGEPLVLFATVWHTKLTALHEPDIFGRTVRAFLTACKQLRENGVAFNAVVKDRPSNAEFGKDAVAAIAAEVGFGDYSYGVGDMEAFIVSADLLVSCNSNSFVEAMAASVPAINLWTPSTWFLGPGFDAADGIPMVPCENASELADLMRTALTDPAYRAQAVATMERRLPHYHVAMDGGSTARFVDAVISVLAALRTTTPLAAPAAVAPPPPRSRIVGMIARAPRTVLVIGRDWLALAAEIKGVYPNADIKFLEDAESGAGLGSLGLVPHELDLVAIANGLDELYDAPGFLSRLKPYLFKDAQLLTGCANIRNLWLIEDLVRGRWKYGDGEGIDPRRLRFYTMQSAASVLNAAGFEIDRVEADPDARAATLQLSAGTLETAQLIIKNPSDQDLAEFRSRTLIFSAKPAS